MDARVFVHRAHDFYGLLIELPMRFFTVGPVRPAGRPQLARPAQTRPASRYVPIPLAFVLALAGGLASGSGLATASPNCAKFPEHSAAWPKHCGSSTTSVTTSTTTTTTICDGISFGKACGAPVGAEDFDPFVTLTPGEVARCVVFLENSTCRTLQVQEIGDVIHHVSGDEVVSTPVGPLPHGASAELIHDSVVLQDDVAFRCNGSLTTCVTQTDCPVGELCIGFCADSQQACLPDQSPACRCVGILPDTGYAILDGAMEIFPGGVAVEE